MNDYSTYQTEVENKMYTIGSNYFTTFPPFLKVKDNSTIGYKYINFNTANVGTISGGPAYGYSNATRGFFNAGTIAPSSTGTYTAIVDNGTNTLKTEVQDIYLGAATGLDSNYLCYTSNLYAWYDILSETNWPDQTTGKCPSPIDAANTSNTMATITPDSTIIMGSTNTVTNLKNDVKFNPFVARRMVRLMILLGNMNIALKAGDSNLISLCYQLLKKQNYAISNEVSSVNSALGSVVQQSAQDYRDNRASVEKLAKDVKTKQTNYKGSAQLLNDRAADHATQRKYEYVALAMFLIAAVGAAIILMLPMERNQKIMGSGLLIILSVVNAFTLNYLKNAVSTTEGFYSYNTTSNDIASYQMATLKEASAYIDNTFNLAHLLESYKAYGNMNSAIRKDINYYYDSSQQLLIANRKVKGVNDTSYLQDLQYSALMNMLITLSLIVAGMTSLQVATEPIKSPTVNKVIVGTGGTLAVISLTIYLVEASFRVHTKPKQFYWNQPSPNSF